MHLPSTPTGSKQQRIQELFSATCGPHSSMYVAQWQSHQHSQSSAIVKDNKDQTPLQKGLFLTQPEGKHIDQ